MGRNGKADPALNSVVTNSKARVTTPVEGAISPNSQVQHIDGECGKVLRLATGMRTIPGALVKWDGIKRPLWYPLSEMKPRSRGT